MGFRPMIRRLCAAAAIAAASGAALAGCGSSSPQNGPHKAKPHSSSSTAGTMAAESAIKTDWEAFFAADTPVAKRVDLLQNGPQFRALIEAQSKSPLASEASAKVTSVSGITSSQAAVTYSIVVAGTPALSGQHGVAVYQDGTWKVGDKSFCGLLIMEGGKKAKVPPACQSAS